MRVAAFQKYPIFDDLAGASETLLSDLHWAAARNVDLALFPESFLGGHSYHRPTIERRAIRMDGPEVRTLLDRVSPLSVTAVIGVFERRGAELFTSALVSRGDKVVGVYAKSHPNEPGVTAGVDYPTFLAGGCRFGVNICNDANHLEPAQRVADKGAKLLCYPLNNLLPPDIAEAWRMRSVENLQARARQTGCWIAAADVAGRHGDFVSYGCTAIVAPDGTITARASELLEGVALFDLP